MLQFEELKLALDELKPDLSDLEEALDLKAAGEEIEKLEAQAAEPEFWNDMSHSQKILQRTSTLKNKVSKYNALKQKFDDIQTLIELGNEAEDVSILEEAQAEFEQFKSELEVQRLSTLLQGEYDGNNAILDISLQGRVEPKRKIGPKCYTVCTAAGVSVMVTK